MKNTNIKKLKYPLWLNIIFYICTVIIPITCLIVNGLKSSNKVFKISFTVISLALISWIFIRKFLLKNIESKLLNEKAQLEHDFQIEAGNLSKCKCLWYNNEFILNLFEILQITLIGLLIMLIANGIEAGIVSIRGVSLLISLCYGFAYCIKLIYIIRQKTCNTENDTIESEVINGQTDRKA